LDESKKNCQWDATENFAKFLHLLWDLGLIQRFLPERQDILVLIAMLRYSDFHTGECTVFIGKLAAEAGVAHPTQVRRIQARIVAMGAFWRPEGKKGFKKINGKWVARFYRSTGKQIVSHAIGNDLISEEKLREIELRHVQEEIDAEAEQAVAAERSRRGTTDLNGFPETVDEITDDEGNDQA